MEPVSQCSLARLLTCEDRPPDQAARLAALVDLFAGLPAPPDPFGLVPRWDEYQRDLLATLEDPAAEAVEEAFLILYAHLHGHEAPYTPAERRRMDAAGGYWNHAGGLTPVLKAPDHLRPDSVSVDFGAGNGLQLLLVQHLSPHACSVQVELSSRAVAFGRELQTWLGIPADRVDWRVADVLDAPVVGHDFIYLYRPVRPEGAGRAFYRRFARELAAQARQVVIFSIADCLGGFLPASFERFYTDGQLTCYKGP